MFKQEEFEALPAQVRSRIISDSLARANGEKSSHAFEDIISDSRHLAIAARMSSKPLELTEISVDTFGNVTSTGNNKAYTGKDIADIFVDSVVKNGYCYYPLTGDWTKVGVKQLVVFVKVNNQYTPYARFDIDDVELNSNLTPAHLLTLTNATPAVACKHKSVLRISNVQRNNLPQTYLGLRSGKDLKDSAFKGSAPNVIMI